MLLRVLAGGAMALGGALFVGLLVFGPELPSYLVSSAGSVRHAAIRTVPLEFELQRARDMLNTLMPEIHSKIRLVAREQVEIASLKKRIRRHEQQLARRELLLQALRKATETRTVSTSDGSDYHQQEQQLRQLSLDFDQFKQSESLLASQRELLQAREVSFRAAKKALEDYRSQKDRIERKIESLTTRHQLVKARKTLAPTSNSSSHLAKIDELLIEVEKRIDVASRILDHETEWLPEEAIRYVDEADLLTDVDRYLRSPIGTVDAEMVEGTIDDTVERVID